MIHSNIAILMKAQKKRIIDLAEQAKIDELTVKRARSHKTIGSCKVKTLHKIAVALNVAVDPESKKYVQK